MTVTTHNDGNSAEGRDRRESKTLYAIIKTASSSLALDRMLDG